MTTCCPVVQPSDADEPVVSTRGTAAEWLTLKRSIAEVFKLTESAAVSANHPCAALLQGCNHRRVAQELRGHGRWQDGCYTRTTLVHEENYVVMLLCWAPGVTSPVHAHSDAESLLPSNCFMRVLEGELCETFYAAQHKLSCDAVAASEGSVRALPAGGYTYINDEMGVHKVGNPHRTERAVSLHVYAPGWKTVQTYDEIDTTVTTDASGAAFDVDGWGDF